MPAKIIDGKAIAAQIRAEAKIATDALKKENVQPCLAVVLVGEDPASKAYVGSKVKACEETGIKSVKIVHQADITEQALLHQIDDLNNDDSVHGVKQSIPILNLPTLTG